MIDNPQPIWLPFLVFALPGIGFVAYAVNNAIFPADNRPLCTIPAIGIVLALLPAHIIALTVGSITIGLSIAWSIVGAVGYRWIARHWRELKFIVSVRRPASVHRLAIAALVTLPIVAPTILLNFHDETSFNGHHAIIAHLQNGTYPPRYLYEPTLPLRYHYAFDLAGAIITGLCRVRVDHAIDILTLALWPCMFLLLWRVGEHVGGRRAGLFVALAVCFSGGWPIVASTLSPSGFFTVNGLRIGPPFVDNFFQHPWSIGMPIFCLAMLQRAVLSRVNNQILGFAALVCSLSVLSLSHAVLFATTVVALGLTEIWRLVRSNDHAAALILLALGASLLGAKLIGGFFVSVPFPAAGGFLDTGFRLRDWSGPGAVLGQLQWNLATFGILLVLGVVGLFRVRLERMFLATLTMLTLVIVNLFSYKYSWDIVKFGAVSFIALAIGTGIILDNVATWADNFLRRAIFVVLIVAAVGQGLPYPFIMLWGYRSEPREPFSHQMIRPYFSTLYPVDTDNARVISFLRRHMRSSDIVYRSAAKSEPYAIWGGLPTQGSVYTEDGSDDAYGLGEKKLAARKNLATISTSWLDRLLAERITWVVTDIEDNDENTVLDSAVGQRRAVMVAQHGNVRIFHLESGS